MTEPVPPAKDSPPENNWPHWLLRRTDQATVAVLVASALAAMVAWWIYRGGLTGGMIELEQLESRTAEYHVDVNSADWPELAQLPGIGSVLAQRIIQERESGGPYLDYHDLARRVPGIGPRTLARIRPYLRPITGQAQPANPPEAPPDR